MQITIHRGTNEIGGSCVEVATAETRILIDLGLPLDFGDKTPEDQAAIREQAQAWCEGIDAVFVSHYHQDHTGLLPMLPSGVPVYMTAGTKKMAQTAATFSVPNAAADANVQIIEPARKATPATPIAVGDIAITAFTVDHSAYDACAFLIESNGKRILYGGDIRTHGKKGPLYRTLPKNVDCLLLEGTNVGSDKDLKSEENVKTEMLSLFEANPDKLAYVWCSGQNIDRLSVIAGAAFKNHRTLVVDLYVAACLYEINLLTSSTPSPMWGNVKVLYNKGYDFLEGDTNYAYLFKSQRVRLEDITKSPGKYVLITRPSMLRYIQKEFAAVPATYTISIWRKYMEKEERLKAWCAENDVEISYIHSSGHADRESLQEVVRHIDPGMIIPIHTESKEKYPDLFPCPVVVLDDNEPFELA